MYEIYEKVLVKVSEVMYISVTTYQKAFIFGPHSVAFHVGLRCLQKYLLLGFNT